MTKEEQLKAIILSKHKSVSAFAEAVEIPYTTVISILKRGIDTAGIRVAIKIFDALNLDIESVRGTALREKKKDPPAPQPAKQKDLVSKEDVENVLVALGITQPGEHLTDADLEFLSGIVSLIRTWFDQKGKQG